MRWAAICALALLPGCSLGGDEEPGPSRHGTREIVTLVSELQRATRHRDPVVVCRDLLTPAARQRAGGAACPQRVRPRLASLRDPHVQLLSIRLHGARARARVRTRAAGAGEATATLALRRVRGEWRIDSLR